MPYNQDGSYRAPTCWSDIDSTYIQNGDCADWIYAIRDAILERANVMIGGNYHTNDVKNLVAPLIIPIHDCVEIFNFARGVEIFLDKALSVSNEWGTNENVLAPHNEESYFVHQEPANFMKKYNYNSGYTGEDETDVIPNYLRLQDMLDSSDTDYKSALIDVRRGDLPYKFVPFFSKVKNVLNKLTVIPCRCWVTNAGAGIIGWSSYNLGELKQNMIDRYNDALSAMPQMGYYSSTGGTACNNYVEIETYPSGDRWYANYHWENFWVKGISSKLPNIDMNLYQGTFAYPTLRTVDENEYAWGDAPYTYSYSLLGKCTGHDHNLPSVTSKFPSGGLLFPATPPPEKRYSKGYYLDVTFFADFGISGGFNYRTGT